jgi:hypothetical protein
MNVNVDPQTTPESNDLSVTAYTWQTVTMSVLKTASRALREQGAIFAYVHGSVANGTASTDSDLDGELFLTVDEGAWIGRTASSWKR